MKKINSYLIACALVLAAGCGGSGGERSSALPNNLNLPANTNALLSVYVSTATPAALTLNANGKTVEITTALMGLSEVKLRTASTTDAEATELSLPGPFIINLETETVENLGPSNIDDDADDDGIEDSKDSDDDDDGIADASDSDDDNDGIADEDDVVMDECEIVDALELPLGTYTKIEAKLDKIEDGDGIDPADPLAGRSLYIEGTYDGIPFLVTATFDEEFEVVNPTGIVVEDGSLASFILSFDIAGWFEGIDLATADMENGIVLLDSGHNQALFEQFRDNVKATMDMENDSDNDGIPDSED